MKKAILFSIVLFIAAINANSQTRVGIIGGGNLSKVIINGNSGMFSNENFKSYHAGFIADMPVSANVYIQPRLTYVRKGGTLQTGSENGTSKLRMHYAELGTNVVYKRNLSIGKVFAGGGAYGGYGFKGSLETSTGKSSLFSSSDNFKRFDAGLNLTAGIELNNGLFLSVNTDRGLLDVYKPSGASLKHRSFSVSIGYFL